MSKGLLLQLLHLQLHVLGCTHEFEPWLTSWDLRASPQSHRDSSLMVQGYHKLCSDTSSLIWGGKSTAIG